MAIPRQLEGEGHEFPSLSELGALVGGPGLEFRDLVLDLFLPLSERLPVDVAGEVEVEQALPLVRQPVETPGHEPGLLGPVPLAGDDLLLQDPLQAGPEAPGEPDLPVQVLDGPLQGPGGDVGLPAAPPGVEVAGAGEVGEVASVPPLHHVVQEPFPAGPTPE
ncbi:MAG: hypothetical protein ACRDGU_07275 [Actinomycetota bacterium]